MQNNNEKSKDNTNSKPKGDSLSFEELVESEAVVEAVHSVGYERPTELQSKALPALLSPQNSVLIAPAGSGKRTACAIAIAAAKVKSGAGPLALVLVDDSASSGATAGRLSLLGLEVCTLSELSSSSNCDVIISTPQEALEALQNEAFSGGQLLYLVLDNLSLSLESGELDALLEKLAGKTTFVALGSTPDLSDSVIIEKHFSDAFSLEIEEQLQSINECHHIYYDVGTDLLAKPNALAAILESMKFPATIVYCNLPSDTDLLEVMLKKKGIKARKLVGRVPRHRVNSTARKVRNGQLDVMIVTDISGRSVDLSNFEMLVNYSIHDDPEVYFQRVGASDEGPTVSTVVNLISPVDITNFHYLKKIADFEFEKRELPLEEELAESRFKLLEEQASELDLSKNPELQIFVSQIERSENSHQLIALLADSFLSSSGGGISGLIAANARAARASKYRASQSDKHKEAHTNTAKAEQSSGIEYSQEEGGHEEIKKRSLPPKKDVRFYIGHGSNQNFSEETFRELLKKHCPEAAEKVKRFNLRELYSFADLPEEIAEAVEEKLQDIDFTDGKKFFIKKAIAISVPREELEKEAGSQEPEQAHEQPAA
ncbi:MAG: DEAD/DEAH box helicase [Candidatus Dadabacteria bacterium]|nr:MAG: DEAD/DEAH box helicase [Candidatus Dadabacteria bacterium]